MYMDFKHKILKCVVFNIWIHVRVRACMLSRVSMFDSLPTYEL